MYIMYVCTLRMYVLILCMWVYYGCMSVYYRGIYECILCVCVSIMAVSVYIIDACTMKEMFKLEMFILLTNMYASNNRKDIFMFFTFLLVTIVPAASNSFFIICSNEFVVWVKVKVNFMTNLFGLVRAQYSSRAKGSWNPHKCMHAIYIYMTRLN